MVFVPRTSTARTRTEPNGGAETSHGFTVTKAREAAAGSKGTSRATGRSRSVMITDLPARTARMYWPNLALSREELTLMDINVH